MAGNVLGPGTKAVKKMTKIIATHVSRRNKQ